MSQILQQSPEVCLIGQKVEEELRAHLIEVAIAVNCFHYARKQIVTVHCQYQCILIQSHSTAANDVLIVFASFFLEVFPFDLPKYGSETHSFIVGPFPRPQLPIAYMPPPAASELVSRSSPTLTRQLSHIKRVCVLHILNFDECADLFL